MTELASCAHCNKVEFQLNRHKWVLVGRDRSTAEFAPDEDEIICEECYAYDKTFADCIEPLLPALRPVYQQIGIKRLRRGLEYLAGHNNECWQEDLERMMQGATYQHFEPRKLPPRATVADVEAEESPV